MNEPRLEDTGRGFTVFSGSRYLYSRHNPAASARKIAESIEIEERCLYLVPSPLLGYGLPELSARLPPSSQILALEYSQELMALCAPLINPGILRNPKITWIRASENLAIHQQLKDLGMWRFRRVKRVDLSGGVAIYGYEYADIALFIARDIA